jgi:hypothetical protein
LEVFFGVQCLVHCEFTLEGRFNFWLVVSCCARYYH